MICCCIYILFYLLLYFCCNCVLFWVSVMKWNLTFLPFHVHDILFPAWFRWIWENFIQWRTPVFLSKAWRSMITFCLRLYSLSCGVYSYQFVDLGGVGKGGTVTYNLHLNEILNSGARLVVHWWRRCFCFWISRAPRFIESYRWPNLF